MKCGRPGPRTPTQPSWLSEHSRGPRAAEAVPRLDRKPGCLWGASRARPRQWVTVAIHRADSSSLLGVWQLAWASLFPSVTLVSSLSLCSCQLSGTPLGPLESPALQVEPLLSLPLIF